MSEDSKTEIVPTEVPSNTRRTFIRTAAQIAVTAPAVAVLLNATTSRFWSAVSCPSGTGTVRGSVKVFLLLFGQRVQSAGSQLNAVSLCRRRGP